MVKIIGHRGAKEEYPENTLGGFLKACKLCDGFELDVHLTKDGKLAVIHDDTLDRTTNGKGRVESYNYSELEKLNAGNKENFEKIPLLSSALKIAKKHNKYIFIEIKCLDAEKKVASEIKKYSAYEIAIVKSFDHQIVKKIKKIDSKIKTACLIVGRPVDICGMIKSANADAVSINLNTVDKSLIDDCHSNGYMAFVWNVNDKKLLKKYVLMGADFVGTNMPSNICK